jgi:hypothetical protein
LHSDQEFLITTLIPQYNQWLDKLKRHIKPTSEQRNEVNDLVLDIQKLLEGKEWGPSLAALTICIGEMGEMIDTEDQLDFVSYVAGVISGILHVRSKDLH